MYRGGVQNQAGKDSKNDFRPVPVQKFTFPVMSLVAQHNYTQEAMIIGESCVSIYLCTTLRASATSKQKKASVSTISREGFGRNPCGIFPPEIPNNFGEGFCADFGGPFPWKQVGGQNLYTNALRRCPPQTPGRLFGVYVFSFFPHENKLFGIHQTFFWPVETLEFSELRTPLVYTFSFRTRGKKKLQIHGKFRQRQKTRKSKVPDIISVR